MQHHYGDIKTTKGADGDAIDVFIGDNPDSEKVFIVDQVNPETGVFDEAKVMMGFDSIQEAEQGYRSNYDKDWDGLGNITETTVRDFKHWARKPRKSKQPFASTKEKTGQKQSENLPVNSEQSALLNEIINDPNIGLGARVTIQKYLNGSRQTTFKAILNNAQIAGGLNQSLHKKIGRTLDALKAGDTQAPKAAVKKTGTDNSVVDTAPQPKTQKPKTNGS